MTFSRPTLILFATTPLLAQSRPIPRPEPTGTVTGHVLCADTQRPARLAQVKLVRVPSPTDDKSSSHEGFNGEARAGDPVETSLDGSYTVRNVKPGRYYVVVDKEGYLIPLAAFSAKELAATDDASRDRIAQVTHTISVAADQATREDVTLQRGASISGTVLYDDGSPASAIGIRLLVRDTASEDHKWIEARTNRYHSYYGSGSTDDNGHYRISGLPPGEYATEAILSLNDHETQIGPMPNNPTGTMEIHIEHTRFSLPLYSGDVFRKPQAVPYTLGTAEVRSGSDLVFPLAKLHKVSGQAITKNGRAVNAGNVELLYADDKSKMTEAIIAYDDQAFHLDYVPEGDFLLKVKDPKEVRKIQVENAPGYTPRTHEETKTITSYGDAEQPLLLKGDTSDILITVPDLKPSSKPTGGLSQ